MILIITQEFYVRCRASQELIFAQIPWATAGAERSRDLLNVIAEKRTQADLHPKELQEVTTEERLLAALLGSNEELLEALRMYDDMQRMTIHADEVIELERISIHSKVSIFIGAFSIPNLLFYQHSSIDSMSFAKPSSTSSSASPSPLPSRSASFEIVSSNNASPPLPSAKVNHPTTLIPGHAQSLAPPPPAPHGPRLLAASAVAFPRSRTPSPERPVSAIYDSSPQKNREVAEAYYSSEDETDFDTTQTPMGLSEKALGKRRVLDTDRDRECSNIDTEPHLPSYQQEYLTLATVSSETIKKRHTLRIRWTWMQKTIITGRCGTSRFDMCMMLQQRGHRRGSSTSYRPWSMRCINVCSSSGYNYFESPSRDGHAVVRDSF